MDERRRKGLLIAAALWLLIIGGLAAVYKYVVHPRITGALVESTGSESQYKHTVVLRADAFSGYAVLRSEAIRMDLRRAGVRLKIEDDNADYIGRMKALRSGDAQMAVFTVDAFLTAAAAIGDFPATIVMVIDETIGADAIVGYKDGLESLQALDNPDARIVATPSSPSEFLARTVVATLSLPRLPEKWLEEADGAEEVYKRFKTAGPKERRYAYVLWEPFVTKSMKEKGTHVLLDSSKMKGYIVDVLVARRRFLQEHADVVETVVTAYSRAAYSYSREQDGMQRLVMDDAKAAGEPLSQEEAKNLVSGIRWKNMLENYAHFGVVTGSKAAGAESLEEIIPKIADVLERTGAIESNPVAGKAHTLFYRGILQSLHAANFHPSKKVDILDGIGPGTGDLGGIRQTAALPPLNDEEWTSLSTVGAMRVEAISFRRGTAEISSLSESELTALATKFQSWPSYYMRIVGHARAEGDVKANQRLARQRAEATKAFLEKQGVAAHRMRVEAVAPKKGHGSSRAAVAFVLGQKPF